MKNARDIKLKGVVCAIDVGTSVIKAGLIDESGMIVHSVSENTPLTPKKSELFGFIPEEYAKSLKNLLRLLTRDHKEKNGSDILSLCLTSQRATVIALDKNRKALAAFSWIDTRCDSILPDLIEQIGAEHFHEIAGLPLTSLLSIAKIYWFKKMHRNTFDQTEKFVLLYDYLLHELGVDDYITDYSNASCMGFLNRTTQEWDPELMTLIGINKEQLPVLERSGKKIGILGHKISAFTGLPQTLPIIAGGGDQEVACLGMGVCEKGDVGISLGTSASVFFVTNNPDIDYHANSIVIPHVIKGQWVREGFQISFASSLQWYEHLLEAKPLNDLGKITGLDKTNIPVFVPFFVGGGIGINGPTQGVFAGISISDRSKNLAVGVLEGVIFELRFILEQMTPSNVNRIIVGGGASSVPGLLSLLAEVFNGPVEACSQKEAALLGAGALAWSFIHVQSGLSDILRNFHSRHVCKKITPSKDRNKRYLLYTRWREALHGIHAAQQLTNSSSLTTSGKSPDFESDTDARQKLMESAGIGLFRYSFDGTILEMDKGTLKILEIESLYPDPKMVLGKNISDMFHYMNRREVIRDRTKSKGNLFLQEYPFTTLGGKKKWSLHDTYITIDKRTGKEAIQVMARDITKLKEAESELRENKELLLQADKLAAIGQLAGGVAHDFNNQLAGIMGYAELIQGMITDKKARRFIDGILSATQHASELTKQLLAFARKGKYLSIPVDIHDIISEVRKVLDRLIDKNIRVREDLRSKNSTITGDPTQIQSALLNLCLNARDALPYGGKIRFETCNVELDGTEFKNSLFKINPGNFIKISLIDNGYGMSDEIKKHLFEPFFTTKSKGEGTGLGLASVLGAIRNHHGAIEIFSEQEQGTMVNLYFPLGDIFRSEIKHISQPSSVHGSGNILLVDDEEIVLNMAKEMLEQLGYSVCSFSSAIKSLEYYRRNWKKIKLVILDIIMPDMRGGELLKEMRKICPDVPCLLSSGYSPNHEIQKIINVNKAVFVPKPYHFLELSVKIKEALNESKGI